MSPRSLLLMMICTLPVLASADDLVVPVGQQGADKASLERPLKGMAAAAVEQKFGAPLSKSNPVGTPPISSWEYPEYRVYFEADRVLHSVLKPMPTETAPAPAAPVQEAPSTTPAEAPSATPAEAPSATPAEAPTPAAPAEVE
jgi:hypothetical protein